MVILFGAGHVAGAKIWMGYNEDKNMFDLAQRKAVYAAERYGQKTKTFYVTGKTYPDVEVACRGCKIASWEHSDAVGSYDSPTNRVKVFRTVKNPGNGPCLELAKATGRVLGISTTLVEHKANSAGNDWYGVIGRAMKAGCQDSWLHEHGFHTHKATREKLLNPDIRQQLAVAEVDALARYYGWGEFEDMLKKGSKGEEVRKWQKRLIEWNKNALPRHKADASFGDETVTWTNNFLKSAGLAQTGQVGPDAWFAMGGALTGGDCSAQEIEIAGLTAELKRVRDAVGRYVDALDNLRGV